MTNDDRTLSVHERLYLARRRLDGLLNDGKVGAVHALPDETLDLVTNCLNAIADVIERRRELDAQPVRT